MDRINTEWSRINFNRLMEKYLVDFQEDLPDITPKIRVAKPSKKITVAKPLKRKTATTPIQIPTTRSNFQHAEDQKILTYPLDSAQMAKLEKLLLDPKSPQAKYFVNKVNQFDDLSINGSRYNLVILLDRLFQNSAASNYTWGGRTLNMKPHLSFANSRIFKVIKEHIFKDREELFCKAMVNYRAMLKARKKRNQF